MPLRTGPDLRAVSAPVDHDHLQVLRDYAPETKEQRIHWRRSRGRKGPLLKTPSTTEVSYAAVEASTSTVTAHRIPTGIYLDQLELAKAEIAEEFHYTRWL